VSGGGFFCGDQFLIYRNHEIYSVATKTHSSYKNSKFNGFIKLEPFLDECQGAALFWPSQISIDKMRKGDSPLPFPDWMDIAWEFLRFVNS